MGVSNPPGATMAIVAHPDDDLLFMNPDILSSIRAGGGHTTVFVTAGDAGQGVAHMLDREAGAKAAYSAMAGSDEWVPHKVTLSDGTVTIRVHTTYLQDRPDVRLYHLRLPDGNPQGGGYRVTEYQSLARLFTDEIDTVQSLDGNSYSAGQLAGVLRTLMERHAPETLLLHDPSSKYVIDDHSDHVHTAQVATAAAGQLTLGPEVSSYIGYASEDMPPNLAPADMALMQDAFLAYAKAAGTVRLHHQDMAGNPALPTHYAAWLQRQYRTDDLAPPLGGSFWSAHFGRRDSGATQDLHLLADITGDQRADIVGFSAQGVSTALSTGREFDAPALVFRNFGTATGGWDATMHDRVVGDVNGDRFADVVGFGDHDVLVALADGTGDFRFDESWSNQFTADAGWRVAAHVRTLGDVDGDGRSDIVAFGNQSVWVARSDGTAFVSPEAWVDDFTLSQGWQTAMHPRVLADVDGDGRDDIVGFGASHVIVARSTGDGFRPIELWSTAFTEQAGWSSATHARSAADVNGDGLTDLIGIGAQGVEVALSNGQSFAAPHRWSPHFGNTDGWHPAAHAGTTADVNGDGRADVVGFGNDGVLVLLSDGKAFISHGLHALELREMQMVDWTVGSGPESVLIGGDF